MSNDNKPDGAAVLSSDQLGGGQTVARDHLAFFPDWFLKNAALEDWESAMAASGRCPKCSDSLATISECSEMRFMRCMGCDGIFVVPPNAQAERPSGATGETR